ASSVVRQSRIRSTCGVLRLVFHALRCGLGSDGYSAGGCDVDHRNFQGPWSRLRIRYPKPPNRAEPDGVRRHRSDQYHHDLHRRSRRSSSVEARADQVASGKGSCRATFKSETSSRKISMRSRLSSSSVSMRLHGTTAGVSTPLESGSKRLNVSGGRIVMTC